MDKLQRLNDDRDAKVTEMEQLLAVTDTEDREFSEEEQSRFDQLNAECDALDKKIHAEEAIMKRRAEIERAKDAPVLDTVVPHAKPATKEASAPAVERIKIPATVKKWGKLEAFKGPDGDLKAYKAGKFLMAVGGNQKAMDWCFKHGLMSAAQQETVNTRGGYLVYDELDSAIIDLRDEYGVFAANARRVPMTSDVKVRPRRTGGLTAYFVGEDEAATESNKSWDAVTLTAKKLAAITRITNELSEDAIISVADDVAREIAYAFAQKVDQCGFIGDGTSTYGGIEGVSTRLATLNSVDDGGGLVLAAGNLFSEVTLANLNKVVGILPAYAHAGAKWYCSSAVYGQVLLRLAYAASGNDKTDIAGGMGKQILGYPVALTEVLPTSDANSQNILLFGNLAQAADFGDRRQTTIKFSDSAVVGSVSAFERDETAVIGTMRFDINAHDLGTASAAGPVVALVSAAA